MLMFVKYFMQYLVYGELSINVDCCCYPPGGMRPLPPSHPLSVVIFLFTFLSPVANGELLKAGTTSDLPLATATKGPLGSAQIIQYSLNKFSTFTILCILSALYFVPLN